MHKSRFWTLFVSLGLITACGDGGRGDGGADDGTSGPTGVSQTNGDPTGDDATGSTGGSVDDTTSAVDTTGGPTCETVQCGDACCAEDEECVLDECMPACASEVRCGEDLSVCCDAGDVCLQPDCVSPGSACIDSFDCAEQEFCEPTIGACLPQQDPVVCEVIPDFDQVEVALEWSWEDEDVIAIPLVADVDGDDFPEVIVGTTWADGLEYIGGAIVVLDGQSGNLQFRVDDNPPLSYGSYGRTTPGVADVDGNALPDIIYAGRPFGGGPTTLNHSLVYAVDGSGTLLWESHNPNGSPHYIYVRNGAPTFANLDSDPESEIIYGAAIIDNDGTVVWDDTSDAYYINGGRYGSNDRYWGGISTAADLTGDGYPEVISGRHAWSVSWVEGAGPPTVTLSELWDAGEPDGYPAVGDLDQDGDPEVVIVARIDDGVTTVGTVRVVEGDNGNLWCGIDPDQSACFAPANRTQPIDIPGGGRGGPPTIADFDGDGRPEIGVAGGSSYTVYDLNRSGETIVQPVGDPPPQAGDMYVRWTTTTQDESSNSTGSSVFDFQGDGVAEVLYGDECFFRVYDGRDGTPILQEESVSRTIHEYPIVVDVDADGNSEILVVSNDGDHECGAIPSYPLRQGVFVYGDPNDEWVRTRRVWNTHDYHVTNSDSRGLTPATDLANWTVPELNNFRQNVQGQGVFNAPDLQIDLAVGLSTCLDEEFELVATVRNNGSLGVPMGIDVSLYEGTDATGMLIGTEQTTVGLLPGAFTTITWLVPAPANESKTFYAAVDGADMGLSTITECDEDNNDAATETVTCGTPG